MRRSSFVLVLGLLATGCFTRNRVVSAFRTAHPECRGDLNWTARGRGGLVYDVEGCGTHDVLYRQCEVPACQFNTLSRLRQKASFELGCDVSALQLTDLGQRQVGITGCGRRVSYVSTAAGWIEDQSYATGSSAPAQGGVGIRQAPQGAPPQ